MDLFRLTLHDLRDLIQKGEVSPVQVVHNYLVRIGQVEDRVQAFNTLTPRTALAFAGKFAKMQAEKKPLPPLAGIPLAIKDVICTKGVTTTCSSRILESYIPPYNASVINRLNASGALMLGKTNMDEFAMGSSTENSAIKQTRNPWELGCVPGGSSGGSAAAVAADMCAGALGTDTGAPSASLGASAASPR